MIKRNETARRYASILALARKKGSITNAEAVKVSGYKQIWYHLDQLRRRGLLAHVDLNRWVPTYAQQKRPRKKIIGKNIEGQPWEQGKPWCPGCGRMELPKYWTDCDCLT